MRPIGLKHNTETRDKISRSQKLRYEAMKEAMDRNSRNQYFRNGIDDEKLDKLNALRKELYMNIGRSAELLIQIASVGKKGDEVVEPEEQNVPQVAENKQILKLKESDMHNIIMSSVEKIMRDKKRRK